MNSVPLKTVAAIVQGEEIPSPLDALGLKEKDYVTFEVPTYQRGLRWNDAKRRSFIKSLYNGWPTGAIVLTRLDETALGERNVIKWHVIDGQQRISTFQHFRESFWKKHWYEFTDEMKLHISSLAEILSGTGHSISAKDLEAGIQLLTAGDEHNPFHEKILSESSLFLRDLCHVLDIKKPEETELSEHVNSVMLENLHYVRNALSEQKRQLENVPIALITINPKKGTTYNKAREISAEIFVALNSGVALSKYELINSQWISAFVPWAEFQPVRKDKTSAQLKEYMFQLMKERISLTYNKDDDLEDDPDIAELNESDVTLYDYLYALSQCSRKIPIEKQTAKGELKFSEMLAFPGGKSENEIAFDIAALVFTGSSDPGSIATLKDKFPVTSEEQRDIQNFANVYFEAISEMNSKLPFAQYSTENNKKSQLGAIQASTYVAAYIATVFSIEPGYSETMTVKVRSGDKQLTHDGKYLIPTEKRKSYVRSNIATWFLFDSLDSVFQGNQANTESRSRVWNDFSKKEPNEFLLGQPSLLKFMEKFKALFISEFEVNNAPLRRKYSQASLSLFQIVYQDHGSQFKNYTMDHVMPWQKLGTAVQPLEQPIPLNHPANFMPLSKSLNSSRKNTPWSTYIAEVKGPDKAQVVKDLLIDASECTEETRQDLKLFAEFLLKRWVMFIDRALQYVGLDKYQELSQDGKIEILMQHVSEIAAHLEGNEINVDVNKVASFIKNVSLV